MILYRQVLANKRVALFYVTLLLKQDARKDYRSHPNFIMSNLLLDLYRNVCFILPVVSWQVHQYRFHTIIGSITQIGTYLCHVYTNLGPH